MRKERLQARVRIERKTRFGKNVTWVEDEVYLSTGVKTMRKKSEEPKS